jgi:protein-tyrosine phosphatase
VIDLHTHVLPAIDDGVETEDEALEFARVAAADGVRVIVATPHCRDGFYLNDRARVLDEVARLRERLARENVPVTLEPGAEVHLCPDLVQRIGDGRAPTLGDNGRTLLLELSLSQYPVELENLVFQLRLAGIDVVFAHPERIRFFQDDVARYAAVVHAGAYGQITTGSILGQFGRTARAFSTELLRKGLVHVLASDAHNVRGRPPVLSTAVAAVAALVGECRAEAMVQQIPAALLAGREPVVPPVELLLPTRRGFLGWLSRRGR